MTIGGIGVGRACVGRACVGRACVTERRVPERRVTDLRVTDRWVRARRAAGIAVLLGCLGLGASACAADRTGSLAHRVRAWESGTNYSAGVEVVHTDVARIDKAIAGRAHPGVVEFDCLTLGQDVNKDYSTTLPTPDVAFSTDLGNAYEVFLQYSSDCVNHKGSPASVAVDAHYITTGNQDLAAAQARSEVILK